MDFLSQTEKKLAAEISGNYQSLLEQQRDHEVSVCLYISAHLFSCIAVCALLIHVCIFVQLFQAEMFSRQQILYSIISDGHHMLDQGQVDDG